MGYLHNEIKNQAKQNLVQLISVIMQEQQGYNQQKSISKKERLHQGTKSRVHTHKAEDSHENESVLHHFSHTVDFIWFGIFYKFLFNRQMTLIMEKMKARSLMNVKSLDLKLLPLKIFLLVCSIYVFYDTIHHLQNSRMFSAITAFLLLHDLLRMAFNCSMRGYFLNSWRKFDIDIHSMKELLEEQSDQALDQLEDWMIFGPVVQWDTIIEGTFWKFVIAPFVFSIYSLYENMSKEMI
jgi:hypothetical protein